MRISVTLLASGLLATLAAMPAAHAQPYGPPPGAYGGPPPGPPGFAGPGYHWHGRSWHHRRWVWDRYHRHHYWQYY